MRKIARMGTVKKLARYLIPHRKKLLEALGLSLSSNLLALICPVLLGRAVDAMAGPGQVDFRWVAAYGGSLLVLYLLSVFCGYRLSALLIRVSRQVVCRLENQAFSGMLRMAVASHDKRKKGDLISILSYDCSLVYEMLSSDFVAIGTSLFTILGSFFMMLLISGRMTVLFCFTIPLVLGITRFLTSHSREWYKERSACMGVFSTLVGEAVTGNQAIQAYGCQQEVCRKLEEQNAGVAETYYRAARYSLLSAPAVNFINNSSLALVGTLGAVFYLHGILSLGSISSFVLYSRKFAGLINEIVNQISELQASLASAERVFSLLEEIPEEEAPGGDSVCPAWPGPGELRMEHVTFSYSAGIPVLQEFSIHALPGTVTAIVGPTGAGKTTILNLLLRFYDYESGAVYLDGQEIRSVPRYQLRRAFALVQQEAWMFHGTVYENLVYGNPGTTREEVQTAARNAQIHEYILGLPKGYETVLGEQGISISRGQLQLLAIARAMLSPAPVVILDEATSHVDTRTEKKLQTALNHLIREKTCLIIAHRLSTVEHADQILVLEHGRLKEQGTHGELMEKGGLYYTLVNARGF